MKSQEEHWLLAEKYHGEKSAGFFTDCKALALGEPLAYLIGSIPFLDCKIYLDNRPLIPRVETEFWVEKAIAATKESQSIQSPLTLPESEQSDMMLQTTNASILDLCAGSGCIGVAVAKALPMTSVDFAEIDARLLPAIHKNIAENLPTSSLTRVFHSNLFADIPSENKYNIILSNPPYIDPTLNRTDENVKDFEPHLALFGGANGLEIINQLIADATAYLTPGGQLWIEHEPEQTAHLAINSAEHGFQISTHTDQYGVNRYSILVLQ